MKTIIYSISLITFIFITACSSNKVIIRNYADSIPQHSEIDYSNYWSAVLCASPEIVKDTDVTDEHLEFAKALEYIKLGQYSESEMIFENLLENSKNDTITVNSKDILKELLWYQNKWTEYYDLLKAKDESKEAANKRLVFPSFMGKSDETIIFTKDVDTIEINVRQGLIFVPVEVNGKSHEFLFDTGAQLSAITDELGREFNVTLLQKHDSALVGSTEVSSDIESGFFNTFKIGNFYSTNQPCFVVNKSATRFKFLFLTFFSFDGIIGWNTIKNMDVEIDAENEIMIIRKPVKKENTERNLFWLSHPIIKFRSLTGVDMHFFYDSGAQESNFYDLLLMKLKPDDIEKDTKTIYGIGGKLKQDISIIPDISFFDKQNRLNFINMKSGHGDSDMFFKLDGQLGNDISKQSKFRIDALNGLFEVTPNE